jgi:hypothetical protein
MNDCIYFELCLKCLLNDKKIYISKNDSAILESCIQVEICVLVWVELAFAQGGKYSQPGPPSICQSYNFVGSIVLHKSRQSTPICIIILLIFIPYRIAYLPAFKAVKNEMCKNHTLMTIEHIFQGSLWAIKSKN